MPQAAIHRAPAGIDPQWLPDPYHSQRHSACRRFLGALVRPVQGDGAGIRASRSQLEPNCRLAKLNTENEQAIATQYRIQSIPTLALFKNGKEVARQAGAMGTADIVRWVQAHS